MAIPNGFHCPSVSTLPATGITNNAAILNGSAIIATPAGIIKNEGVVPVAAQYATGIGTVSVSFEYGTVQGVYTETTAVTISQSGAFQTVISELTPCTTYYYRAHISGISLLQYDQGRSSLQGAGVGLDGKNLQSIITGANYLCTDVYGEVLSFQTTGCQIGAGGATSHNSSVSAPTSYAPPVTNPVIVTQSASLSSKAVTPGTPVTVTADIINKSSVNGSKKVTLYVNGQVETTQGVSVGSGGSSRLTFNVSRSEPGDYVVYVDGAPAGSFKVEMVTGPDMILIFSALLVGLAFVAGMIMLWRRQQRTCS